MGAQRPSSCVLRPGTDMLAQLASLHMPVAFPDIRRLPCCQKWQRHACAPTRASAQACWMSSGRSQQPNRCVLCVFVVCVVCVCVCPHKTEYVLERAPRPSRCMCMTERISEQWTRPSRYVCTIKRVLGWRGGPCRPGLCVPRRFDVWVPGAGPRPFLCGKPPP